MADTITSARQAVHFLEQEARFGHTCADYGDCRVCTKIAEAANELLDYIGDVRRTDDELPR